MKLTIFLDIDGVLNTRTTVEHSPDGYTGIDDARVDILARAIAEYGGGDIVLSSDWKDMKKTDDDYIYLLGKLEKYGLCIKDKTIDSYHNRGEGIQNYLEKHHEVEEFVILDDNVFDFREYSKLWERLLLTNGIENSTFAAQTPAIEAILFQSYIKDFS